MILPNISVVKGVKDIVCKPKPKLFPAYLNVGENGEIGIKIYNYIIENYPNGGKINEIIYINGIKLFYINKNEKEYIFTNGGEDYYVISSKGYINKKG